MCEMRFIIIAKQCEVARKSSILNGCLKKILRKRFFGHPSRIDGFPCNLTQFCYKKKTVIPTDQEPWGCGQYDGQWVYCGLSTASEVLLIFATKVYSCLCNYDAIVSYIDKEKYCNRITPNP